jgi:putative sterol carrier protein
VLDSQTLKDIVSGETDGMQAFMGGKLRVEGDMMLSMKLSELFPS